MLLKIKKNAAINIYLVATAIENGSFIQAPEIIMIPLMKNATESVAKIKAKALMQVKASSEKKFIY